MALSYNEYIGDGTTVLYSFTFPYMDSVDVKVSLDSIDTDQFTFQNATTILMYVAPELGTRIKIYRQTDQSALEAVFYSGSAIRAQDLNDNFNQIIYIAQESDDGSSSAEGDAALALIKAEAAEDTANAAQATADTALSTANTADANALAAQSTADQAIGVANGAMVKATQAEATANTAIDAVSSVLPSTIVANVAAIPSSPAESEVCEVADSTGIESFSPLTGLPVGFIGDAGISVKIQWQTDTWIYLSSTPNNPDERYVKIPNVTTTAPEETDTVVLYRNGVTQYCTKADFQTGLGIDISSLQPLP